MGANFAIQDLEEAAPGTHAPLRGNPCVVVLTLCIPVLVAMLPLAAAPGILQMAEVFGTMTAQLVLTLPAVVMIIGASLAGYMSERYGRRTVIVASLFLYAIAGSAGFFADSLGLLVCSRIIVGFSAGVLLTTIYAVLGEYYDGLARERLLGLMSMAASGSAMLMLALMGRLVESYGWRISFLFYMIALLLVPFALRGLHKRKAVVAGMSLGWRPVLAKWPYYVLLLIYSVAIFMMIIQAPFLLSTKGVTSPSTIGWIIALSSLAGALSGVLYGFLRRSLNFKQMFVFMSFATGGSLLLAAWAPTNAFFIAATLLNGLGIGMIEATVASEILMLTPEPLHDRAMGVNVGCMFLGQFLNPFVVAPLVRSGSIEFAFDALGGFYLVCGILFLLMSFMPAQKIQNA